MLITNQNVINKKVMNVIHENKPLIKDVVINVGIRKERTKYGTIRECTKWK